jgi:hypothetical protein
MKNLFLFYIPQASLFALGYFAVHSDMALRGPVNGTAAFGGGLLLAAAYTGGVNLVIDISRWISARRARALHESPAVPAMQLKRVEPR